MQGEKGNRSRKVEGDKWRVAFWDVAGLRGKDENF